MDKQDSKNRELLSAVIDGELSEFELRRFLQWLESVDDKDRERLLGDIGRWIFIGDVLRKDENVALVPTVDSLVDKVRAQIEREPLEFNMAASDDDVPPVGVSRARPSWLKALGGLSVAATVAAVVVLGYQVGVLNGVGPEVGDGHLATNLDLGSGVESDDLLRSPKVAHTVKPHLRGSGSTSANGLDLVSAESVKSIDRLRVVSDPMSQRYSAYFILHSAMGAYQQNVLLPMTRVMDTPLDPSNP